MKNEIYYDCDVSWQNPNNLFSAASYYEGCKVTLREKTAKVEFDGKTRIFKLDSDRRFNFVDSLGRRHDYNNYEREKPLRNEV